MVRTRFLNPIFVRLSRVIYNNYIFTLQNTGGKDTKGAAAMYGMVAKIPDKSIIDDFIVEFFSEVYKA